MEAKRKHIIYKEEFRRQAVEMVKWPKSNLKPIGDASYTGRRLLQTVYAGRISGLLNFLLVYFSFLWNKELHVAAGDLSGT
jgi:hypothetical protein